MSFEKISKHLHRSILTGLYAALLMPFIYVDNLVFPFITGKVLLFQILIEILFVLYCLLAYIDPKYRPKKSALMIAVSAFIGVWVLATLFGVDRDRSFWGNYERMSGTFTILHFYVYFLMLVSILRTRASWHRYLTYALFLSGIQAVIGIIQYYSTNFLLTAGGGKIWGTLGNYIYLATYSLFHIFLGGALFSEGEAFAKDSVIKNVKFWRVFFGVFIILNLVALYLSGTRGGYLGLLVGVFVVLIFLAFGFTNKKQKRIVGTVLCLALLLAIVGWINRDKKVVKNLPIVGPLINLKFNLDTGETRLIGWKIALKAWKERPVLGWGPENYYYAFNKYFDPRSLEHGYYETWFDRPHNTVLDILATQGALGGLAYASIFVITGIIVVRRFRKRVGHGSELAVLFGGMLAYFVQNLFVFDQPSSFLLFYLFLAWINFLGSTEEETATPAPSRLHAAGFIPLTILLSLGGLGLIYMANMKPWKAGTIAILAERAVQQDFSQGYNLYREAAAIQTPYQDDTEMSLARIVYEHADNNPDFIKNNKEAILFAISEVQDDARIHPNDVFAFMALGQLYGTLAQVDPTYFPLAEKALLRGAELSPGRQQIYYILARFKVMQKDYEAAHTLLTKAINLDQNVAESYWYQGLVYNSEADDKNALAYLEQAEKKHYSWKSVNEIFLLGHLFENAKRFEEIPPLLEEAASLNNRAEIYVMLANAYKKINQLDKAERAIGKALELDPKIAEHLQQK